MGGRQCLYLFGLVSVWHLAIIMGMNKHANLAVAKAPCVNHQIAEANPPQHRRQHHHRNQGGNIWDLAAAQTAHAEATSTTLGKWMEDSQLARRTVVQLEESM